MTLAIWLVVVGLCDLVRAARDATSLFRRSLIAAIGTLLLLGNVVWLQPPAEQVPVLLVAWVGTFLMWVLGSAAALPGRQAGARVIAFVGLGGGLAVGLVHEPMFSESPASLPGLLSGWPADQVLLVLGVCLVQLATANVAVRLLLDAVGVPAAANEKTLKGGRLLGPMERLFVVGLGLAGHLTAASIVVAAKGLLRFPELQRDTESGPTDVTEYFLIGSFASWLLALGGVGLAALGSVLY